MLDFWRDSGHHLLHRQPGGRLAPTDDFLRAYLLRPEMHPNEDSCRPERDLHAALMRNPREAVSEARLAALADPDARHNYRVVLQFRDRLLEAGTVQACYFRAIRPRPPPHATSGPSDGAGESGIPPLFIDQMAHVILREILDGCDDGLRARAAELLFRSQKVTIVDGTILAADAETVEMQSATGGLGSLGRLIVESRTPVRGVELDVLTPDNADSYWRRERRYDTVLDLSFAAPGLDALCRVLEAWVGHFLDVKVQIQPLRKIEDEHWAWHVGLDSEGSKLLDDLYGGAEIEEARMARLLALFRLDFAAPEVLRPAVAGRPVYLAMAMTEAGVVRLKPQNLLVNLPLIEPA